MRSFVLPRWLAPHKVLTSPPHCLCWCRRQAFVHFECMSDRRFRYILGALNQGMRALAVAKETYVRINEDGIMCVQHQVSDTSTGSFR